MVLKVHVLEEKLGQEVQDEAEEGPSPIIYLREQRGDVETVCFPPFRYLNYFRRRNVLHDLK